MNNWGLFALPREVVEKYGDYRDWRNVVGTGPLMLTEFVEGVSVTWKKNPDYWATTKNSRRTACPILMSTGCC